MIEDSQKLDRFYSILVGITITCVGYLVAFYYEKSFLSYFGIPQSVISFSITTLIHPFSYIITIVASAFIFVFFLINTVFISFYDDGIHKYISKFLVIIAPVLFVTSQEKVLLVKVVISISSKFIDKTSLLQTVKLGSVPTGATPTFTIMVNGCPSQLFALVGVT